MLVLVLVGLWVMLMANGLEEVLFWDDLLKRIGGRVSRKEDRGGGLLLVVVVTIVLIALITVALVAIVVLVIETVVVVKEVETVAAFALGRSVRGLSGGALVRVREAHVGVGGVEKGREDGLALVCELVEVRLEGLGLCDGGVAQLVRFSLDDALNGTKLSVRPALDAPASAELLQGRGADPETLCDLVQRELIKGRKVLWGDLSFQESHFVFVLLVPVGSCLLCSLICCAVFSLLWRPVARRWLSREGGECVAGAFARWWWW